LARSPFKLVAKSATQVSQGAGLDQPLSAEEGRARFAETRFPTEQFVDGRPVAGLGAIVEAIGDPRTAWL
jgi:hypothetical protein